MTDFTDFGFPVIKNVSAQLLSDQLVSFKAPTLEEMAKGRPVREYPVRYDHFRSMQDMIEYLRLQLTTKHKDWKPEWLSVGVSVTMPINIYPDVYYTTSGKIHSITCVEPQQHVQHDMLEGGTLLKLDPKDWMVGTLEHIVAEVQKLLIPE
jgi:hypothetical protein